MKITQSALLSLVLLFTTIQFVQAQEINRDLKPFCKVVVSPKVHLILEQGDKESIRVTYDNVDADKINIKVQGNTLRVYLDEAKVTEKTYRTNGNQKKGIYHDVSVTA